MAEGMRSPAGFEIRRSQLIHSSQEHRLLRQSNGAGRADQEVPVGFRDFLLPEGGAGRD